MSKLLKNMRITILHYSSTACTSLGYGQSGCRPFIEIISHRVTAIASCGHWR